MAGVRWMGRAALTDPVYGLSRSNMVPEVTKDNWRRKAAVRVDENGWVYVWLKLGIRPRRYFVCVLREQPGRNYQTSFAKRDRALAYVNGEDGGLFAQYTRPAEPREYPADRDVPWTISFVGMRGSATPFDER